MVGMQSNSTLGSWPDDELETVARCPVCGSEKRVLLHAGLTDRIFFCAPGEWSLFRCTNCESGYLDPRPKESSISLAYESYYTHQSNQRETDYQSLSLINKVRRTLANGYRNWRFGTQFQHAAFIGVIAVMLMPYSRKHIEASMRHLPKRKGKQSLLDFGCGNGDFLRQAKQAGWECIGIDFDIKAVEAAQSNGLDVRQGGIDTLQSIERQFDYITLSHVIEHVYAPKALLAACYDRLKPGGSLWIETPNLNSQGHDIYGTDWRGLEPPRHLVLYTPQSLFGLLKNVGFSRVEHQREHPAVSMLFSASEAIRSGGDPWMDSPGIAQEKQKLWRKYERRAKKTVDLREFITLLAIKSD